MFQPWNTSQRAKRPGQVSACGHSWQIACPGWQIACAGWQIACVGCQIACAGWQVAFVSCCGQLVWLVLAGRLLLFFVRRSLVGGLLLADYPSFVVWAGYCYQIIYAAWSIVVGIYEKMAHRVKTEQCVLFYVPSHLVNQLFVLYFAILLKIK
jgi:hypothetical protein